MTTMVAIAITAFELIIKVHKVIIFGLCVLVTFESQVLKPRLMRRVDISQTCR